MTTSGMTRTSSGINRVQTLHLQHMLVLLHRHCLYLPREYDLPFNFLKHEPTLNIPFIELLKAIPALS